MKKHRMPDMKEGGVNVTPLIDIVMCLIIFFMLVAKIGVSRGVDKDIKLPSAILGAKISDLGNTLSLNLHDVSGDMPQVTTNVKSEKTGLNVKTDLAIYVEATKDRPLRRVLQEFKKTHPAKAEIIIRGDKGMEYSKLETVLVEISAAGITDTAYETTNRVEQSASPSDSTAAE